MSKNSWNQKTYYMPLLRLPAELRPAIESAASASCESVSAFINRAILARMGLTEWPDVPTPSRHFDRTPAPACVICGNPLPEGRLRYCSDACRRKGVNRISNSSRRHTRVKKSPSD